MTEPSLMVLVGLFVCVPALMGVAFWLHEGNGRLPLWFRRRGILNRERSDALLRIERAKMEAEVRRAIDEAEAPTEAGEQSGRLSVVGGRHAD